MTDQIDRRVRRQLIQQRLVGRDDQRRLDALAEQVRVGCGWIGLGWKRRHDPDVAIIAGDGLACHCDDLTKVALSEEALLLFDADNAKQRVHLALGADRVMRLASRA